MSYKEALADKVPSKIADDGYLRYYPPCRVCGTPVISWSYLRRVKYMCPDCREIFNKLVQEKTLSFSESKQTVRLKQAIRRISRVTEIAPYEKAINSISLKLNKKGWFQSTEEIMVALELMRHGVVAHHQVNVYDYSVDFYLPDLKVALEIDGSIFHGKDKERKELIRDELIAEKLQCEVVRISTENINKNITKLLPAIRMVLRRRKKQS